MSRQGSIKLAPYHAQDPAYTALDLSFQKLSTAQINEVASILEKSTVLTSLNLANCKLGENLCIILRPLERNTTLRSLDITYNDVPKKVIEQLEKILLGNCMLSEIKIKENQVNILSGMKIEQIPPRELERLNFLVEANVNIRKVPDPLVCVLDSISACDLEFSSHMTNLIINVVSFPRRIDYETSFFFFLNRHSVLGRRIEVSAPDQPAGGEDAAFDASLDHPHGAAHDRGLRSLIDPNRDFSLRQFAEDLPLQEHVPIL
jgi:hypothetical protein